MRKRKLYLTELLNRNCNDNMRVILKTQNNYIYYNNVQETQKAIQNTNYNISQVKRWKVVTRKVDKETLLIEVEY